LAIAIVQVTTGTAATGAIVITGTGITNGGKTAGGVMNLHAIGDGITAALMNAAIAKAGTTAMTVVVLPDAAITDTIIKITPWPGSGHGVLSG